MGTWRVTEVPCYGVGARGYIYLGCYDCVGLSNKQHNNKVAEAIVCEFNLKQ